MCKLIEFAYFFIGKNYFHSFPSYCKVIILKYDVSDVMEVAGMKRVSRILLLVFCMSALMLSGCKKITDYQKSIYNDNSKIAKEADSYNYLKRISNIKENNANIIFDRFYGMDTIWTIDAEKEGTITINYKSEIKSGSFKAVIIAPDNEVNLIFENSQSDKKDFLIKEGKTRIKIIGNEAKGELNLNLKLDKQMKLK
jgi:hypothetical protein